MSVFRSDALNWPNQQCQRTGTNSVHQHQVGIMITLWPYLFFINQWTSEWWGVVNSDACTLCWLTGKFLILPNFMCNMSGSWLSCGSEVHNKEKSDETGWCLEQRSSDSEGMRVCLMLGWVFIIHFILLNFNKYAYTHHLNSRFRGQTWLVCCWADTEHNWCSEFVWLDVLFDVNRGNYSTDLILSSFSMDTWGKGRYCSPYMSPGSSFNKQNKVSS